MMMDTTEAEHQPAARIGAAGWLGLAAAPTFAVMALVNGMLGDGGAGMICGPGFQASPFTGMAWMYLLMSGFHLTPWLKLLGRRSQGTLPAPNR